MADDIKARLAAARAAKTSLDNVAKDEAERRELVLLELEIRLSGELGPRGDAFEIIDGGAEGPIAVKLGDLVVFKRFQASILGDKQLTPEIAFDYVAPCLAFPSKDVFAGIFMRRPGLATRCATALQHLFNGQENSERSKF